MTTNDGPMHSAHRLMEAVEDVSSAISAVHGSIVDCGTIKMPCVEDVPLAVVEAMGQARWLEPFYCGYDPEIGSVSVRLISPRCRIVSKGGVSVTDFNRISASLRSGEWG